MIGSRGEDETIQRLRTIVSAALREPVGSNEPLAKVCRACVELLPVDGASVSVMSATQHRETLFVTDETIAVVESLQFTLGEGPCFDAFRHRRIKWETAPSTAPELCSIVSPPGALPAGGYSPMRLENSVLLGTGGGNDHGDTGEFFEGAVTAGYPTDATENAVQASLTAAGYGSSSNIVTVTNPGNQSAASGTPITAVQIHATDSASGQSLTYSATGLPPGLSISSSGLITGTPSSGGTFTPSVTATDTTGAVGSISFTWTVSGNPASSPLHAVGAGKCLDDPNSSTSGGTQQQIWDCNGGVGQNWTHTSSGQLTVSVGGSTFCLDANGQGASNGTKAIIWSCDGQANQQWNINSNGTITGAASGLCLDVTGASAANGALVELWSCNGGSNQQWKLG
jgi:hypothetical protein